MADSQMSSQSAIPDFGLMDSRLRVLTLNVALIIGALTTCYFGISDIVHRRFLASLASLFVVIVFGQILLLNMLVPRLRKIIEIIFVALVGIVFIMLLATRFPAPAIVLWCFPFPLLALFLLGRKPGAVVLVVFNLCVMGVFILGHYLKVDLYTYDYAVRYCGVMIVISILSYYYESSRARAHEMLSAVNESLEQRVEERTSALEESQERLRQAEKLEAIGLLAGGIAHDFNNQLAGIMAFADLIRVSSKDNDDIREYSESILAGSRRSAELTTQLLAFARKGALLAAPFDMHLVMKDVISLLKHTIDRRIDIRQELHAGQSTVLGDQTRIQSALLNIALNARDAITAKGELKFSTDIVEMELEFCKTFPYEINPGTYLHVSIADTGCGMDKKTMQRIFEPFFTTKERGKGSGMGLAAVYGTVLSHKGAITVNSEPGQGSTFHLYFPLLKTNAEISRPAADTNPEEQGHGHVLLVDDEPTVSFSMKKMLQQSGYTVTLAGNGREALDYYMENWKSVDLVILDMIMPVMGGRETFIAMKQINPAIAALLASGYSLNGDAQSILDMGIRGFIQKPFDIARLCQSISSIMRKST
jgi:signal transduction histidine kinase/ActR/RegA family two-component response regulator